MQTIINGDGAYVGIIQNYFDNKTTASLWKELVALEWARHKVMMRGKMINQARETYGFGDSECTEHKYAGAVLKLKPWSVSMKKIRDELEEKLSTLFQQSVKLNSCLLNKYNSGSEYISYHSDTGLTPPLNMVATISLGGSRDFILRQKKQGTKPQTIKLNNGDCLIMTGRTQELYEHTVPKRAKAELRISLTFRLLSGK